VQVNDKKPKEYKKIITLGPFPYEIYVILTEDINNSRSGRSHFLGDWDSTEDTIGIHSGMEEAARSYIFLGYEPDISSVVHEAYHAVWRVMEYLGAHHENEVMAYILGHIVREIVKHVEKISAKQLPKCQLDTALKT
jgi:hypothetical protein